jgi:hypothetical protein
MAEKAASARDAAVLVGRRVFSEAATRRRRARNRENMRRRRADPAFRAYEKHRRERKQGDAAQDYATEATASATKTAVTCPRRCSICGKRDAIEVITRLRPSADSKSGYVQMRIAYCGFC